jgi:predicted transcriptional regulator
MESVKQEARAMLERLSDSATFDDVHYQLYLLEKLRRSDQAIAEGKVYTQDEVERAVESWHTK